MKIHKIYKTSDIILASSLRVLGHIMDDIELVGTKGTFVFSDIPQNVLTEYDLGKLLVEPVNFNNTIKQLTTSVRRMST
jgi:hypothetical protein